MAARPSSTGTRRSPSPEWLNNTINIDTGCVFGGKLTALRWPERELVSVPASRTYYEPAKPFLVPEDVAPPSDQDRPALLLDLDDVAGKRIIQTRLTRTITIREENAAAALEVMSRFAMDPRWLVYLPPTMAPTATSMRPDLLEHPESAFAEYRSEGVPLVICEEKHMGSRAIVIVCRDADVARTRFGVDSGETGAIYTRTGRPFLDSQEDTEAALSRIRDAADAAGLWTELDTNWIALDCELMPWSAKAMELIRRQYAAVGAAAHAGLAATVATLETAHARGLEVGQLLDSQRHRVEHIDRYVEAYRRYVWPVDSVADLRLAPFHILAAESGVFADHDHAWHLERCDRLVAADPDWLQHTERLAVDVTNPEDEARGSRLVGGADSERRRGHGRKANELHRARAQRHRAARHQVPWAASTCASSTAPSTPSPTRSSGCARGTSVASARSPSASSGSASRRSSGSCARAALPRPRMRLRRPRDGERAGRSAAVGHLASGRHLTSRAGKAPRSSPARLGRPCGGPRRHCAWRAAVATGAVAFAHERQP